MPDQKTSKYSRLERYHLTLVLLSYTIFAAVFGLAYRYAINPDGTSVLRLAGYLAKGHFQQSVSSGYSPFFTWLVSIFIFLGFEGLTAARITVALCGAGLLVCCWFLARRFDLPQNTRLAAMLVAVPLVSFWTIQFISPDVLFAALLLYYLYLVTDHDVLNERKLAFFCGISGGFAYLAHHYAMPFFFMHFPVMLMTKGYMDKGKAKWPFKRILTSWAAGVTGFFMIASLWIGILSVKYGHISISPKGGIAHAIMGPPDKDRRHPFFVGGLFKPRDSYAIHIFEDISDVKFETWSPFESREYFIHQLKVIKINAVSILDHFITSSPFFTRSPVLCILVLSAIAFWLSPLNKSRKFLYAWVAVTFSIYCSGFLLLIARSPRRFYALMIVFILLAFHFLEDLKVALKSMVTDQRKKIVALALLTIIISAFALKPSMQFARAVKHIITEEQVNPYKEIADQVSTLRFSAPYAVIRSSQKSTTDYYIAYFLRKQLLGRPLSKDIDGVTRELEAAGGRSLVVFDKPGIVEGLKHDGRYVYEGSLTLKGNDRYKNAAKWVVSEHEIITGWDDEVSVFTLK